MLERPRLFLPLAKAIGPAHDHIDRYICPSVDVTSYLIDRIDRVVRPFVQNNKQIDIAVFSSVPSSLRAKHVYTVERKRVVERANDVCQIRVHSSTTGGFIIPCGAKSDHPALTIREPPAPSDTTSTGKDALSWIRFHAAVFLEGTRSISRP